jgi:hypothetical protein
MKLIDQDKFKEKFKKIWLAERRFSHESLGISLDDLLKAIDQPEFQVKIKSPEEVERVMEHFKTIDYKTVWDVQDMIDFCEWILCKNKSYDNL